MMFVVQFFVNRTYVHWGVFINTTCFFFSVNQQYKLYVYVKISEYKVTPLNKIKPDKTYNIFLQLWNVRVDPINAFHVISCKQK